MPPISVLRLPGRERERGLAPSEPPAEGGAHSHDFLVLAYFERGGGSITLAAREWPLAAGDAYVIAPGEVVGVGDAEGFGGAEGWAAFFPPEVLGLHAPGAFLSWLSHPLLFPFARGAREPGAQRLMVETGLGLTRIHVVLGFLGILAILQMFGRVVIMWLYNATGCSVLLVGLWHSSFDATTSAFGRTFVVPGTAGDAFVSGFVIPSAVVAVFAVLVVAFTRGLLSYRPGRAPQPEAAAP